jgi:hypothetical protein
MRRENEAPVGFDIDNYSTNPGKVRGNGEKIRSAYVKPSSPGFGKPGATPKALREQATRQAE